MRTYDVLIEFSGGIYYVRENSQNEEQEGLHPGRAHRRPGHPGHLGRPAGSGSEAYGKGTAVALADTAEANTTDIGKAACKLAEITDSADKYINDIKSVKLTGTATDGVITKVEVTQGKYICVYEKNGLTSTTDYKYTSGNYGVKAAS